jgi:hypothetical protein
VLSRRGALLACAAVAGVLAAAGLGGGFVWDDNSLILEQAAAPDALSRAFSQAFFWEPDPGAARYYRPVVSLALALQWRLFGPSPLGYHVVNALLSVACTLLAFLWLERRLASEPGDAASPTPMLVPASLLGALLFAAHPSRVQVVSWISGSTDLWSGVFALAALVLVQRSRGLHHELLAATCGGLAVAAKETAVALPLALALDGWLRSGTTRTPWRAIGALAASMLGFFALRAQIVATPLETLWASGALGLLLRVVFTLGWDVAAVVAPDNPRVQLNFELASIERLDPEVLAYVWIGAAALAICAALTLAARTRPALRGYAADLGLFLALLAPSLNVVPIGIGTTCSERFLYLPLLGLCAALARGVAHAPARARLVAVPASLALFAGFALISAREAPYFASDRALQEHFYRQDPRELLTLRKLVRIYARAGEMPRARWMNRQLLEVLDSVTTHATGRAANLITYALVEAQLVPDDDPARLRELRDFLDAASTQSAGTLALRVAARTQRVALSPALSADLARLEGGVLGLAEARIMLRARTLDLEGAEAAAAALSDLGPTRARVQALRARIAAYRGRFDQALALWPRADPKYARDPFVPTLQAANATRSAAQRYGPRSALAVEAVAIAELGLPAQGRALLAGLRREGRPKPALVEAQVRVEIVARRPDRAAALLRDAEREDPANAGQYRAWLASLGVP